MKKRIFWICGGLIWVLFLMAGVFLIKSPNLSKMSGQIVISENMTCFLVENKEKYSVIYEIDDTGKVIGFFRDSNKRKEGKICFLAWEEGALSYLKEAEDEGKSNRYELYQCNQQLTDSILIGELELESGSRPLGLSFYQEKACVTVLNKENKQLQIYLLKEGAEPELAATVESPGQECLVDGYYEKETVYFLTDTGKMLMEKNQIVTAVWAEQRVVWLAGTRAGVFLETAEDGKLYQLTQAGPQEAETQPKGSVLSLDAMSKKMYAALEKQKDSMDYVRIYQSGRLTEISKMSMKFWDCAALNADILKMAVVSGLTVWLFFLLLAAAISNQHSIRIKAAAGILMVQLAAGMALLLIAAKEEKEREDYSRLKDAAVYSAGCIETLTAVDFTGMNTSWPEESGYYDILRSVAAEKIFEAPDGEKVKIFHTVVHAKGDVKKEKPYVIAASDYAYGYPLDLAFQEKLNAVIEQVSKTNTAQGYVTEGERIETFLVTPLGKRMIPDTFLVTGVEEVQKKSRIWNGWVFWIWLAADWVLLVLVAARQLGAVGRFVKNVEEAVDGKTGYIRPRTRNDGLKRAWVSFWRLLSYQERERYQAAEKIASCHRFIPDEYLRLMNKNSADQIKAGEMHQVEGVFLEISICGQQVISGEMEEILVTKINQILEMLQPSGEGTKAEGVFFPDGNLSHIRILYEKNPKMAVQDAIRVWKNLNEKRESICPVFLLHYGTCDCGFAGTSRHLFPFTASRELEELYQVSKKFMNKNVRMIITKEMIPYMEDGQEYRYIGYLPSAGKEGKIRFYEVLEVYPENEKQKRCIMKEKFEQAITLFYQNDFYLARLLFSEVAKECPKDGMTIWYLFACERMFHSQGSQEMPHYLFSEEQTE